MQHSIAKKFNFASLMMFAMPTIIMMVVMSFYTIVDGFFISRFVGTDALSATNIVYPVINLILGIAIMLATGGNAIVAKQMGEGCPHLARETFTLVVLASLIMGAVIALAGNFMILPLVRFLGASPRLEKDCITYLSILLAFSPAFILQILFQTFFVTEGKPGLGLILTILAGLVNAVFDYILIVPAGLGVAGAALATAMGYMVPAVFGFFYFFREKRTLRFTKPALRWSILLKSCTNGSSEMVTNISSGIITFLFNLLLMKYAGENGVAAITIIQYAQFLLNAAFIGFSQGVAPVISFNYGCKNETQLKSVFRSSIIFLVIFSILALLVSLLFGSGIVTLFAPKDNPVHQMALSGFYLFSISFLFAGFNIYSSALFTALSDGKISAILSMVRTFGLIVLSLSVLPKWLGLNGIWLAVPVAEFFSLFLSLYFIRRYRSRYHYV